MSSFNSIGKLVERLKSLENLETELSNAKAKISKLTDELEEQVQETAWLRRLNASLVDTTKQLVRREREIEEKMSGRFNKTKTGGTLRSVLYEAHMLRRTNWVLQKELDRLSKLVSDQDTPGTQGGATYEIAPSESVKGTEGKPAHGGSARKRLRTDGTAVELE
jgi:chromosome segregation ATPase